MLIVSQNLSFSCFIEVAVNYSRSTAYIQEYTWSCVRKVFIGNDDVARIAEVITQNGMEKNSAQDTEFTHPRVPLVHLKLPLNF